VYSPFDPTEYDCQVSVANPNAVAIIGSTYLIISDKVKVVSKDLFYSHELSAIEYTHKLDKYLINTLTFTRPFRREALAPFDFHFTQIGTLDGQKVTSDYWAPSIYVNETYFINDTIKFKQLEQAYVKNLFTSDLEVRNDMYIKIYEPNETTPILNQNATTTAIQYTFDKQGVYKIEYGIKDYSGASPIEDAKIATFYTQILREQKYSLYDMLMRVRAVVPIERKDFFELTRIFNIDATLEERFKKIEMPQMFIQKQTVRQVLNTMFKYINAISRLNHIGFEDVDILSIDEFNKIVGSFDEEQLVNFQSEQNSELYGSKAISWLEQSLQDNFRNNPSIKTPSENRFKTVRAKNVQLTRTQNGFTLPLEKPIYELKKVTITIPEFKVGAHNFIFDGSVTSETETVLNFELDITPRVLNKVEWDLKDYTIDFPAYDILGVGSPLIGLRKNKGGNIYWERNKNEIDFSFAIGNWFTNNIIYSTVIEALNEYFTLNLPLVDDPNNIGKKLLGVQLGYSDLKLFGNNTVGGQELYRNFGFNVEYTTFDDPTQQSDRADITEMNYYSEIRINQQARQTDFGLASRNTYGQLQRGGVPNHTFRKTHSSLDDVLDIGLIDANGFIITQRSMKFYPEHLEVIYEATKDHNRIAEFIGISQEYRVFENPRGENIYNRRDLYNDYIIVIEPTNEIPELPTMISDVNKFFRRVYKRETAPTKVTFGIIRTDGMQEIFPDETAPTKYYGIMTPINSYGGKGAIQFNFNFTNNQVAGNAIVEKNNNFFNEPIRYTNSQGFFDEITFGFSDNYVETDTFDEIFPPSEINANKEYKYPLVRGENLTFGQNYTIYSSSPLVVFKDASSNYGLTYQVSIMAEKHNEYIIGQAFYTDNRAVNNATFDDDGIDISQKMYLYRYNKTSTIDYTYRLFDDLLVKDGGVLNTDYTRVELVEGVTISFNATTNVMSFLGGAIISDATHSGWAIANEGGDLYIACNKPHNGFKASRRHFRYGMVEIGRLTSIFDKFSQITATVSISQTNTSQSYQGNSYSIQITSDVVLALGDDFGSFPEFNIDLTLTLNDTSHGGEAFTATLGGSSTISLGDDFGSSVDEGLTISVSLSDAPYQGNSYNVSFGSSDDFVLGDDASSSVAQQVTISSSLSDAQYQGTTYLLYFGSTIDYTYELEFVVSITTSNSLDYALDDVSIQGQSYSENISSTISGSYTRVQWESGGTQETFETTCYDETDEGNVRQTVAFSCTWVESGSYVTTQDETDTSQACNTGNTRTLCFQDPFDPSIWACSTFDPDVTEAQYETCVLVEGSI
jgi:hypothetical protein